MMGDCLRDGEHHTPGALRSQRDREGVPRVTVEVFERGPCERADPE